MRHRHRPRSWIAILPVVFAMAMIGSACMSAPATPASPTSSGASGAAAEVLDFTAPALGGGTIEGADYAGKDTAIWFWAPW